MKTFLCLSAFLIASVSAYSAQAEAFEVKSKTLINGKTLPAESVFNSFGCTGGNKSPDLEWKNAPAGTKSFAITAYDPDAPTGSGWWHWTIFNLPASVTHLDTNASAEVSKLPPQAVQGRTDFGKSVYGGACPPPGDKPHHYIFTVYALKTDKLEIDNSASGAMVGFYTGQNALAKASLTVTYGR